MLAGLRLDGFACGDDEHHEVDAGRAGEHVLDESVMPWDVNELKIAQMRKAEVDGNPTALFFLKTIRVNAGERADQRGLAVINVPSRADNDMSKRFHSWPAAPCDA